MTDDVFKKARSCCEQMSICLDILKKLENSSSCYPVIQIGSMTYGIDDDLKNIIIHYYREKYNECKNTFSTL